MKSSNALCRSRKSRDGSERGNSAELDRRSASVADAGVEQAAAAQIACGGTAPGGECDSCKQQDLLRRQPIGPDASAYGAVPPSVHEVLRSPGNPLPPASRAFFESGFGHDFAKVRIHTDARASDSARNVNARAYTVGRDIVFGRGEYDPQSSAGRHLLAHELAHVVQQGGAGSAGGRYANRRRQRRCRVAC